MGCTVGFLVGGACEGEPVEHGRLPNGEPVSWCAAHRELGPAVLAELDRRHRPRPPRRCPHCHRTREARRLCEARLP